MPALRIIARDRSSRARAGVLATAHGEIRTPAFVPLATAGAVRGVTAAQVAGLGYDIVLGNTFHLFLRPGGEVIERAGGLHRFMGWERAIITDSGGFQVFSMGHGTVADEIKGRRGKGGDSPSRGGGAIIAIEALGVPLPGETAVILGGLAANQGRLSIVAVIVVAAAAAIVGDNIGFMIGRRGGRALLERPGRFYEERQRMLAVADPFFERHGPKAVFLGRWITGLRVWTSWLAGASDMRWPTFLVWNALGGTAWAVSVALAAYYGGKSVETVFSKVGLYGGIAAIVLIVIGVAYIWRRRRRARAQ